MSELDAIAIVGLACRLPGASDPAALWRLLRDGVAPGSEDPGTAGFDAGFFGVAPREAVAMDPRERVALELAWEGFEDAGHDPGRWRDGEVDVFVSSTGGGYGGGALRAAGAGAASPAGVAGRISEFFGLRGVGQAVDSGGSSSLVAVHLACESLLRGECGLALAGGVDLLRGAEGRGGIARGGIVVLRRLGDAVADGDRIHAVIRGSAVRSGAGAGSPAAARERVMRAALARAGLGPGEVGYVELRGAAAGIGDPHEAAALGRVYRPPPPADGSPAGGPPAGESSAGGSPAGGPPEGESPAIEPPAGAPLAVGSIEASIGDLGGVAGIAGLVKAALCLDRGELVSSSVAIDDGALGLRVVAEPEPWPRDAGLAAAVSSFEDATTGCHVLLAVAPEREAPSEPSGAGCMLWVVSAYDDAGLRGQARRLKEHVVARPDLDPADVGWSLATTRARLRRRAIVVGSDRETLLARLDAVAAGQPSAGIVVGSAGAPGKVAFVFPGQGSQWLGMALELWDASEVFAERMDACAEALSPFVDWDLRDVLRGADGAPRLNRTDVVQPASFAVFVSLAALWRSFGVEPAVVTGSSQGEIAAAHVAGVLSLQDAARVVALRARLLARLDGAMASLSLPASEAQERIDRDGAGLVVGAYNGPRTTVVSGDSAAVHALMAACEAAGERARLVAIEYPAHSAAIEAIRMQLLEDLAPVAPVAATIPILSTTTGALIDGSQMGAAHWYRNEREPVRFEQAIRALLDAGVTTFIEVSPHPTLTWALRETLDDASPDPGRIGVVGSLRRRDRGIERFMTSVAEAHAGGVDVDWRAVFGGPGAPRRVDLPTYAFQRSRAGEGPAPDEGSLPGVAGLAGAERDATLLELVRSQAAAVLGHGSAADVQPQRAFRELGFDSLASVELRVRLAQVTGLELPATLAFDHPTPAAVASLLATILDGGARRQRAVTAARVQSDEPIAIVGMSCRYPGGVSSAQELWDLVAARGDAIGPFPTDRGWDLDRLYDPDPDQAGHSYVRAGGFLYDAADFDAGFFSIAPREASAMDPQQRLVLETAWSALEDAAIDPETLRGSATGVFAGISLQDYGSVLPGVAGEYEGMRLTGCLTSVVSGRVSYALGLQGPAVTIDTACSASLVALHLACQALRAGECSLALAGGVTVMSSPGMFVEFSRQRGLAKDGRSKPFAAAADGANWAEGVGMLVVERLSDARRLGHRVLGLVRGTATNQDGASNGLSAPNGPSQEQVIRQALANAGLAGGDVDAVEAHGTGTTLGDPIEAQALLATYGAGRTNGPLWLGSIKSNIGHAQGAAGVAGVIKMVMAMRAELLPATLHVDAPTPHVDWSAGEVSLLTEAVPWPRSERPRRAGVSSFGISGTNAHVVLEEAPAEARDATGGGVVPAVPWVLSARTEDALREQARRLRAHVDGRPGLDARDVGWSLAAGRARLDRRAVVVGADREALLAGLDAVAANEPSDAVAVGHARARGKVAFVFPGQGSQWLGMALDLWDTAPVFARQMQACGEALRPFVEWDLRDVLSGAPGAPALERMDVVQPVSFAVFVSLAALWRSYGVRPSVVVGHSQGEIAAAHVAGALSLSDAARVAALRSRALVELSGFGGMMSVFLPAADVRERIARWDDRVAIASYNGPRSTVVSGEPAALEELLAACEAGGVRARMIAVDYASHSPQIDAIRERLLEDLAPVVPMAATIPILSTTAGALIDGERMDAAHWFENLRKPVLFEQAIRALMANGFEAFVEASPHPVLTWAVQEIVEDAASHPEQIVVVGSLRRGEGTLGRFLTSAGEAHAGGVEVDWSPALEGGRRVGLPTYPFQRTRYWLTPSSGAAGTHDLSGAGVQAADHPLLGAAVALAGRDAWLLTGRLSLSTHPWLADHELLDEVLLPGSAFVEIALRAGAEVGCERVDELVLTAPLVLRAQEGVQLQVTVGEPGEGGRRSIDVHARPDVEHGEWVRHVTGAIAPDAAGDAEADEPGDWPLAGAIEVDVEQLYDRLADRGCAYGPAFQCVRAAWQLGDTAFAEVALGEEQAADAARFAVHPALLDGALHAALAQRDADGLRLAFSWAGVRVRRHGAVALRVRVDTGGADRLRLTATDERGDPVLSVEALVTRPARAGGLAPGRDALFRIQWTPVAPGTTNGAPPRIATVGDLAIPGAESFADLAAARAAGAPRDTVVAVAPADAAAALELLQDWLADAPSSASRLALLTPAAAAVAGGDVADPGTAAIRGLVRSAQSEHPGRFVTIDADDAGGLARALATGEPEVAVRDGVVFAPRLVRAPDERLPSGTWRLAPERAGAIVAAAPVDGDGDRPLRSGEIRIAVRAAGVNFRDVLIAMGVYPGSPELGMEGAGVVVDVGPDVPDRSIGDRVMGFVSGAFGPLAVADRRTVVGMPGDWTFAQAAAVPVAHATARRALIDLARLQRGERVLIHAAAGGVGLAAVGLAQALGAEVFATASPWKWDALRALGIDDEHLASSRTVAFGERFADIDVVLNCLTGELIDASLALMTRGGRFLELGMTDLRDPAAVAAAQPGVSYRRVDLLGAGPQRLGELVGEAVDALERGDLAPGPVTAWDVRRGSEALAFVSQARHVGKVVLRVPRAIDPAGTVLVTGGTDGLGALVAEHLAREHGARHLLLVSRRGREADSADALEERLAALGCEATFASCDVGDRAALAELLATVAPPLTAVVHAAATSANGMVESLDRASLDAVMRPKSGAARLLDELTSGLDLAAFVLFSSAAGTFGHPGQGNYAAANASLDALAQRRSAAGLPATSVAWGLWEHASGMAGRLSRRDVELLEEGTGQRTLQTAQGLALFDAALRHAEPRLVAVPLDLGALRARARSGELPALVSELVRAPARRAVTRATAGGSLARRLAEAPAEQRDELVLEVVRAQAATALGHPSPDDIEPGRSFKELGFDSLGSVVLRNRLAQVTGLTLPSTLVFDHPTPLAMAAFLRAEAEAQRPDDDGAAPPSSGPKAPVERPAAAQARWEEVAPVVSQAQWEAAAPSANGASASTMSPESPPDDRGYGGSVLGSIAGVVRGLRFRAWVLRTRVRLARVGCRLVVETDGTPRFDDLPHIAFDSIGAGRGSLTLRIGRDCRFGRGITLDLWPHTDGVIEIGDRCHFQNRIRLQPWGGAIRLGALSQVRDGSELKSKGEFVVGEQAVIGRNVTVHCHGAIRFERRVSLAEGVTVMDSDRTHDGSDTHVVRQPVLSSPVLVESNVFVGTNALVLRGSHIGRNSMVATGAVLTGGEYPEGHLLAGVPAIALRPLSALEGVPSGDV